MTSKKGNLDFSEVILGELWERVLVDLVLRHQSGTVASPSDLNQKAFRTVKGLGVGYLKRYGDSDEDTDNSDAEDAHGRTAHHLFVDDTAAGNGVFWHSSSQLIGESTNAQLLPECLALNIHSGLLIPISSPPRTGISARDKGKQRQVDTPGAIEHEHKLTLQFGSPYSSHSQMLTISWQTINSALFLN
jgi:hypothetical protein